MSPPSPVVSPILSDVSAIKAHHHIRPCHLCPCLHPMCPCHLSLAPMAPLSLLCVPASSVSAPCHLCPCPWGPLCPLTRIPSVPLVPRGIPNPVWCHPYCLNSATKTCHHLCLCHVSPVAALPPLPSSVSSQPPLSLLCVTSATTLLALCPLCPCSVCPCRLTLPRATSVPALSPLVLSVYLSLLSLLCATSVPTLRVSATSVLALCPPVPANPSCSPHPSQHPPRPSCRFCPHVPLPPPKPPVPSATPQHRVPPPQGDSTACAITLR